MWSITTIGCRSFLVEPPSLLYLLPLPVRLQLKQTFLLEVDGNEIEIHIFLIQRPFPHRP